MGRSGADLLIVAALAVAVVAISFSGPLIAYAAAPALAIAFWRTALAVAAVTPVAAARRERSGAGRGGELWSLLARRDGLVSALAGVALAVHFGTWVPSVTLTTIATATALVATQPVWQGLIARLQGRRLPGRVWLGTGLALAGAVAATGVDVGGSARAVAGDALALAGAVAAALYVAAGERVRVSTGTIAYTTVCYGVCAFLLGAVCLVARVPLGGYPTAAWLAIAGLVIGPQLLGHSMFSYALRRVPATTVSVLVLLEVPGATLIGWLWLGQLPDPAAWPGLLLLVAGVAVVVTGTRRWGAPVAPPVDV